MFNKISYSKIWKFKITEKNLPNIFKEDLGGGMLKLKNKTKNLTKL